MSGRKGLFEADPDFVPFDKLPPIVDDLPKEKKMQEQFINTDSFMPFVLIGGAILIILVAITRFYKLIFVGVVVALFYNCFKGKK